MTRIQARCRTTIWTWTAASGSSGSSNTVASGVVVSWDPTCSAALEVGVSSAGGAEGEGRNNSTSDGAVGGICSWARMDVILTAPQIKNPINNEIMIPPKIRSPDRIHRSRRGRVRRRRELGRVCAAFLAASCACKPSAKRSKTASESRPRKLV